MSTTVLVTGGAGFVGSHITDHLIERGYDVIVYDNLSEQVHSGMPSYANPDAEYVIGDIRDRERLKEAVKRADVVCHQAASVGVGQSMYEIESYVDVNERGTGTLLDCLADDDVSISKVVVASSMTVYGEGAYYCEECDAKRYPGFRGRAQLERQEWETKCPDCETPLASRPIDESKPKDPTSVYGITKMNQEKLCFNVGMAYDIPTVALRYFGIYGERQSLSNPYTGVCSIFCSRVINDRPPLVFEDGQQMRDFVHVADVARANRLAIESDQASGQAINIGTGEPTTIVGVAETLIELLDKGSLSPDIIERSRIGDVRHGYADVSKARELLGFEPSIPFEDGMRRLVEWSREQSADASFDGALAELEERNIFVPERT